MKLRKLWRWLESHDEGWILGVATWKPCLCFSSLKLNNTSANIAMQKSKHMYKNIAVDLYRRLFVLIARLNTCRKESQMERSYFNTEERN